MRNKLLLVSVVLCLSAPMTHAGGLTQKSLEALRKYCIPSPDDHFDGTPICGSEFEGKYENNTCKCYDSKLQWDPQLRHCVIKCPKGTRPKLVKPQNHINCPKGMGIRVYDENAPACPKRGYKVYSIIKK